MSRNTGSSREVYGVATDGLKWDFLRITEGGVMQVGKRIELQGRTQEFRSIVGQVIGILAREVEVVSYFLVFKNSVRTFDPFVGAWYASQNPGRGGQ